MIEKYKIKQEYVPFALEAKRELSDQDKKIGGIRLIYDVSITRGNEEVKSTKIFLKVFKTYWENSKEECKNKNEWGSTLLNVSDVWLELEKNYSDIRDEIFIYNERITNPEILGMLNRRQEEFTFSIIDNKTIILENTETSPIKNRLNKIFRNIGITYVLISTNIKSKFKKS